MIMYDISQKLAGYRRATKKLLSAATRYLKFYQLQTLQIKAFTYFPDKRKGVTNTS